MPVFEVVDEKGRKFTFEGETAPTDEDIEQHIAQFDADNALTTGSVLEKDFLAKNIEAPLMELGQGASFGVMDEAQAEFDALTQYAGNKLAKALLGGKGDIIPAESKYNETGEEREATLRDYYNRSLDEQRGLMKEFEKRQPVVSTALNIAGGLKSPIGKGIDIPSTFGGIVKGAGLGGLQGALYGFGTGEGEEDRLSGATRGGKLGTIIGGAIPAVKVLAKEITGLTSGAGSRTVGRAYEAGQRGSEDFLESMRGKTDELSVVEDAQKYVADLKRQASKEYLAGKSGIADKRVDIKQIQDSFDNIKKGFNYKGLDTANEEEKRVLDKAGRLLKDLAKHKKAQDIGGVDEIKQAIGKIPIGGDGSAKALRTKIYNVVKDTINKVDPEYANVMKKYETASTKLDNIASELSLKKTGANPYTVLGKLQSALRNDAGTRYGARAGAVASLGDEASRKIFDKVAGQTLSTIAPRGLASKVLGGGLGLKTLSALLSGQGALSLATLPAFSPRAVGEIAYGLGRVSNIAPAQQELVRAILAGTQGE